jgi:hypothetical protein
MVWGAIMGSKEDFTLAPAHAHLNLVGWASLALMGTFYALTGKAGRLGWINFALSTSAVVVMVPFLALYLGGDKPAHNGVIVGTVLAILGMLTFLTSVLTSWKGAEAAEADAANAADVKKAA